MIELAVEERQRIVTVLASMPVLATQSGREEILALSGLGELVTHIDLSGSTVVAVSRIVSHLVAYGRVSWDQEALGLLLNLVSTFIGREQQDFIAGLLLQHSMMVPVSRAPGVTVWRGGASPAAVEEKIITSNTLRPVAFLEQAMAASRPVCHVVVDAGVARWTGTGFLISDSLLITNEHVLPEARLLADTRFDFGYEDDAAGRPRHVRSYRATGRLFIVDSRLDFALTELEGTPGDDWGFLRRADTPPRRGARVNIIQHPGGQPKQIALQSNFVEYVDSELVQYVTATLPGSSGAPVLTDEWKVCAVHHAGGNLPEPTTGRTYFRNEGILLDRVVRELPSEVRSLLG